MRKPKLYDKSFTSKLADAVFPIPPFVEDTWTEFVLSPIDVPFTLTEKVQDALAARVAPVKLTVEEPAVAVIVPPPHVPEITLGVFTITPDGRVSVNAIPLRVEVRFGFVIVKVRLVALFVRMLLCPKVLAITGASGRAQPEMMTLSSHNSAEELFAPAAKIKKRVVVNPVAAALLVTPATWKVLLFVAAYPVPAAQEGAPAVAVSE